LEELRPALERWHVDRIQVFTALPFDRRHRSKIDYTALRNRLRWRDVPSKAIGLIPGLPLDSVTQRPTERPALPEH
jgi:hypothetical protein